MNTSSSYPQTDVSTRPLALVTGASSGIGRATALELGRRGYDLILVARTTEPMEIIAHQLPEAQVEVYPCDLADPEQRIQLLRKVNQTEIDLILNSAGIATFGSFSSLDFDYERKQFELNATALYELTHAVLPGMLTRARGFIINVGSVGGNMAIPGNATYVGTKAFVNTFTESLHYELKGTGVHCTLLAPGPVREEHKAEDDRTKVDNAVPDFLWSSYEDCARDTLNAAEANKLRVVPGTLSKAFNLFSAYIPRRLTAPLAQKLYKKIAEGEG